jgi:hypothetical protein
MKSPTPRLPPGLQRPTSTLANKPPPNAGSKASLNPPPQGPHVSMTAPRILKKKRGENKPATDGTMTGNSSLLRRRIE